MQPKHCTDWRGGLIIPDVKQDEFSSTRTRKMYSSRDNTHHQASDPATQHLRTQLSFRWWHDYIGEKSADCQLWCQLRHLCKWLWCITFSIHHCQDCHRAEQVHTETQSQTHSQTHSQTPPNPQTHSQKHTQYHILDRVAAWRSKDLDRCPYHRHLPCQTNSNHNINMHIHIYIYMYTYICIYIYLYQLRLSTNLAAKCV